MSRQTDLRIRDKVWFLCRAPGDENKSEKLAEFMAGVGNVISITDKNGTTTTSKDVPVWNINSIKVKPYPIDGEEQEVLSLKLGEFTCNFQNYVKNLLV